MQFISEKLVTIKAAMDEAQEAANAESKGSAGDKHETNRAVMQLDKENQAVQHRAALQLQRKLREIDLSKEQEMAELGAVIRTDQGSFFLAISAGTATVDGESIMCISEDSPIGQSLYGAEEGDFIAFRKREYEILAVF